MIPKIIHQIWIGPKPKPEKLMESWKKKNPSWEYRLWDERSLKGISFVNERALRSSPTYAGKSDIMRYELLHLFGGIFIDADSWCARPLDDGDFVTQEFACLESRAGSRLVNGYLGCRKESPLLSELVRRIHTIPLNIIKKERAWKVTGPQLLTNTVKDISYRIRIFPHWTFCPVFHTGEVAENWHTKDIFSVQYWGSTYESPTVIGYQYKLINQNQKRWKKEQTVLKFIKDYCEYHSLNDALIDYAGNEIQQNNYLLKENIK